MTPPTRPLSVWCVSDGRAGIERQTLALADALAEDGPIERRVMRIAPRPPQVWLPPALWPAPMAALPPVQRGLLVPPWPDIWIANGRRSIPYSLWVRRQPGAPFLVQVQDPKVDPARFDLVVAPAHDGLTGSNVVATLGAPVWTPLGQLAAAREADGQRVAWAPPVVLVIVGGTSKRHDLTPARAADLAASLTVLAGTGHRLRITTSRRTPDHARSALRALAGQVGAAFFDNEADDGPNPYRAWLATSDAALVTEDSTNMITDAAFHGLPVHLLKLDGGDRKFDRLHRSFIERGVARRFDGAIGRWTYPPVRDALTVARRIRLDLPQKSS